MLRLAFCCLVGIPQCYLLRVFVRPIYNSIDSFEGLKNAEKLLTPIPPAARHLSAVVVQPG